jgi:hypothetical protein
MAEHLFTLKQLSDNIVEIVLKDRIDLDIAVTDKIDQALHSIDPTRKFYQLVIANGPYMVDPEMRNSMSHGDTGIKQLAIAWVSPDEAANHQQEAIVSKLPLPLPIRFFSDRSEALTWLQGLERAG